MAAHTFTHRLLEDTDDLDDPQAFIERMPFPISVIREWFDQIEDESHRTDGTVFYAHMARADDARQPEFATEYDFNGHNGYLIFQPVRSIRVEGNRMTAADSTHGTVSVYLVDAESMLRIVRLMVPLDHAYSLIQKFHAILASCGGKLPWAEERLKALESAYHAQHPPRTAQQEAQDPDEPDVRAYIDAVPSNWAVVYVDPATEDVHFQMPPYEGGTIGDFAEVPPNVAQLHPTKEQAELALRAFLDEHGQHAAPADWFSVREVTQEIAAEQERVRQARGPDDPEAYERWLQQEAQDPDEFADPNAYLLGAIIPIHRFTARELRRFFREAGYRVASVYKGQGKRDYWSFLIEHPDWDGERVPTWQDEDLLKVKLMGWMEQRIGKRVDELRVDVWAWDGKDNTPEGVRVQRRKPCLSVDIALNTPEGVWGESEPVLEAEEEVDPQRYLDGVTPPFELVIRTYGYKMNPAPRDPTHVYKQWMMPDGREFTCQVSPAGDHPRSSAASAKTMPHYWVVVSTRVYLPGHTPRQIAFALADDSSLSGLLAHVDKVGDYVRQYAVPDARLQTDFIQSDWDMEHRIMAESYVRQRLEEDDPDEPERVIGAMQAELQLPVFIQRMVESGWSEVETEPGVPMGTVDGQIWLALVVENANLDAYVYTHGNQIHAYGHGLKVVEGCDRRGRERSVELEWSMDELSSQPDEAPEDFAVRVTEAFVNSPNEPDEDTADFEPPPPEPEDREL